MPNNNIPEEYLVIINNKECDSRDNYIVKDFFTDEWIDLEGDIRYVAYTYFIKEENWYFRPIRRYSIHLDREAFRAVLQNDPSNPNKYNYFSFKNKEEFDLFCNENNFVEGKFNQGVYFQKHLLKYDRKRPTEFNNFKHKEYVEDYLLNEIYLDEKKIKSKEYRDILEKINLKNQKYGTESKTFNAFEGLRYTYGIELESISGCVYHKVQYEQFKDLNFSGVFDGSLRDRDENGRMIGDPWGLEYVTGVLKGDSGLKQVYDISKLLRSECAVDNRCAYHVHIGSLNWNSEDIVYMYLLGTIIENEVFSIMPNSRKDNEYCKKLVKLPVTKLNKLVNFKTRRGYKKAVEGLYNSIFNIVGRSGAPNRFLNKKTQHPKGRHGGYNRDSDHRYSWLNFTNMIFNQRSNMDNKTIEYRPHSGTLSYNKIANWLKICMAITEFVHIGKKDILEHFRGNKVVDLEYIISKVYKKNASKLIDYIELRKNLFSDISNENVDYINEESNIKGLKELVCA